jgi:tRNA G18 (ribose-2'-O)-methylase SpoU
LLRSSDGFGVEKVILSGYTPYPNSSADDRLPHIAKKVAAQISKTSLGAEQSVQWEKVGNIKNCLEDLRSAGYIIAALEQTGKAQNINDFNNDSDIALIVGNELEGIDKSVLDSADIHLYIPMLGQKESFNVSVAGAMALYHLRFIA